MERFGRAKTTRIRKRIRKALVLKGESLASLAKKAGLSRQSLTVKFHDPDTRQRVEVFVKALEIRLEELLP